MHFWIAEREFRKKSEMIDPGLGIYIYTYVCVCVYMGCAYVGFVCQQNIACAVHALLHRAKSMTSI